MTVWVCVLFQIQVSHWSDTAVLLLDREILCFSGVFKGSCQFPNLLFCWVAGGYIVLMHCTDVELLPSVIMIKYSVALIKLQFHLLNHFVEGFCHVSLVGGCHFITLLFYRLSGHHEDIVLIVLNIRLLRSVIMMEYSTCWSSMET